MEEKRNIFDYLAQVMIVFGFGMLALNLFCLIFGDSAKGFSAMFGLGSQGIPAGIVFQFLAVSGLIVGARFLYFTDICIKNMAIWLRTVCMLVTVVLVIVVFVLVFGWFPADRWQPWGMFLLCFGISFLGSYLVMTVKERMENRQLEQALQRLQEQEAGKEKVEEGKTEDERLKRENSERKADEGKGTETDIRQG